jgi:hypothetical protein
MKIRFGGAAGPIIFERLQRLYEGKWDEIIVPLGLPLRTSARLEPYAAPGHILVEDKFYELGMSQDDGLHDIENGVPADTRSLDEDAMVPVSETDIGALKYDPNTRRFRLQKNPHDPAYHTKLWQIKLV